MNAKHSEVASPVVLITGASSGIGARSGVRLSEAGMTVYAAARRVDLIEDLGPGLRPVLLDLTDEESIVAAVEGIVAQEQRIDVLVNCAGYGAFGSAEETPLDRVRDQFEVNLFGPALLTQLCLPVMRRQGAGRVVNVSSLAGFLSSPLGGWYSASKSALESISDSLRVEVARFGISIVLIEPGPVRTQWHTVAEAELMRVSGNGPYLELAMGVRRVLSDFEDEPITSDPDDVADAVVAAVTAPHPKARYLVGRGARAAIAFRRLLPTRVWDAAVLRRHTLKASSAPLQGPPRRNGLAKRPVKGEQR